MLNSRVLEKKMGNAEKVVFQQQERKGKMLLENDVSTMENIAEEMVFQQQKRWGKFCCRVLF